MTTQPTNLPVPSESPRDLKFNAGKIDEFVTSLVNTYIDRFGNEHYTIEGLRWLAQQAISEYGWVLIDSFQDGADITLPNQALRDEDTGEYYRWDGALPKHVDAGSTPSSSGGVGVGAWIGIGDASLRAMLATSAGAGMVGAIGADGNPTTAQEYLNDHESRLSDREEQIDSTGHTVDLAREGTATLFGQRYRVPHRLVNKTIPNTTSKKYDHFGIMDIKADGTLYQMFRRGATHTDEGTIQYSEFMKNGQWSAVRTIAAIPGLDCRNAAGGTGPDGAMYLAFVTMDPNADPNTIPNVFHDLIILKSKDYGQNWIEVGRFPKQGTDISPYGRVCTVGDRLYITYYGNNSGGTRFLSLLTSDDNGETWYSGPVVSTGVDYNESDLLNLGGGAVLCISRTGSGTVGSDGSNRLRQFISGDGGNTWSDQGYVTGPDSANEIAWQLVSPSLSLVYSNGGTPYVLLAYAARRGTIRYRLKTVLTVTAGSSDWSNWYDAKSINTEFESGYQSQVVINNTIFFNYYAATTTGTVVVPTQFQQPLGELADFDSGWFAVAIGQNYTKPHGLGINPTRFNVMFSLDALGKANSFNMQSFQYADSGAKGVGAVVQSNNSGFSISTGSYALQLGNAFGATHPPDVTTGYIRVVAYK